MEDCVGRCSEEPYVGLTSVDKAISFYKKRGYKMMNDDNFMLRKN